MTIKTRITDGKGRGKEACVTDENALLTSNIAIPP